MAVTEVAHPFRTDYRADADNVDALAEMYETVREEIARLRATESLLRVEIGKLATGDQNTQRLKGDRYTVKVTKPKDVWQQSILKELAEEDPMQSKLYLRIQSYAPNLREINKLEATTGNERFERYKEKILSARQPSTAPPNVSIEE